MNPGPSCWALIEGLNTSLTLVLPVFVSRADKFGGITLFEPAQLP